MITVTACPFNRDGEQTALEEYSQVQGIGSDALRAVIADATIKAMDNARKLGWHFANQECGIALRFSISE